jgi:hypothetical protein
MWVFRCWRSVQTFAVMCWGIYTHALIKIKQGIISALNFTERLYPRRLGRGRPGFLLLCEDRRENWQA